MNKIFTLLAAAGLAMSANATVLWQGEKVISWEESGMLSMDFETPENWTATVSTAMADLALGDKLVFKYKDVGTDPKAPGQIQLSAKCGPTWKWTSFVEADIVGDTYTYTITDEPLGESDYTALETLPERGFFIKGQNATLVEIELVPAAGDVTYTPTDLWTGSYDLSTWDSTEFCLDPDNTAVWTSVVADALAGLQAGDRLTFTYENASASAQISLACKVGPQWTWTNIIPYADIKNNTYSYKITDDAMVGETDYTVLETISERGFYVKGQGATLVKITLDKRNGGSQGGDDPIVTPTTGVTLWEGTASIQTWDDMFEYKNIPENTQWNAEAMSSMVEGSQLVFHYTDLTGTSAAPAQIQLSTFGLDAAWKWTTIISSAEIKGGKYTYTVENAPVGTSDYTDLEMLSEHGFAIKGQHATLVKIELINPGEGAVETIAADNAIDFDAPVEIYTIEGRRVAEMTPGRIYIVRQGDKVMKLAK